MFKFVLPTFALISVEAIGGGGSFVMLHLGGGQFATLALPEGFAGFAPHESVAPNGTTPAGDLLWDSKGIPAMSDDGTVAPCVMLFDGKAAVESLKAAAAAGDTRAINLLAVLVEAAGARAVDVEHVTTSDGGVVGAGALGA